MRRVSDSYFYDLSGADLALSVIHLDRDIFPIIIDLLNCVCSGDKRGILQIEDLAGGLADEEIFKVEALCIKSHEGVLADGAQLDDLGQFTGALHHLDHESGDDDLGFLGTE